MSLAPQLLAILGRTHVRALGGGLVWPSSAMPPAVGPKAPGMIAARTEFDEKAGFARPCARAFSEGSAALVAPEAARVIAAGLAWLAGQQEAGRFFRKQSLPRQHCGHEFGRRRSPA